MSAVSTAGDKRAATLSAFFLLPPLGLTLFHCYSRSTSGKLIAAAYKAYLPLVIVFFFYHLHLPFFHPCTTSFFHPFSPNVSLALFGNSTNGIVRVLLDSSFFLLLCRFLVSSTRSFQRDVADRGEFLAFLQNLSLMADSLGVNDR